MLTEEKIHPGVSTVRYEEYFRSGVVFHGGRDFDIFDRSQIGTGLGARKAYVWFTDSLPNAEFYQDGVIHEGRVTANLAAFADANNFPGLTAPAIADEIFMARFFEGEPTPDCYIITGLTDGCCPSTIFAVMPPSDPQDTAPAFNRTHKRTFTAKKIDWVRRKAATNCFQVEE